MSFVFVCALYIVFTTTNVAARAVNISNTWILPQEGFPVFYRYFRDRISWYEADAVCQFHHANLVTVDTTVQYDASRAYLKELDISNTLWIGLIKSNMDGDFTWTDYRALSGEGYWSSSPEGARAPQCAAADPSADYRWAAHDCGGPDVASFVCELPVPVWASSCLVRALPALTAAFLPESGAIQLTTDCGLAGVRRVLCGPDQKHEDILKELSCGLPDETSTETSSLNSIGTSAMTLNGSAMTTWSWTTDPSTSKDTTVDVSTPQTTEIKLMETSSQPSSSSSQTSITEKTQNFNISTSVLPLSTDKSETTTKVVSITESTIINIKNTDNNEDINNQHISKDKLIMKTVLIPASLNVNDIDTDNLQSNSISQLNQDNDLDSGSDNLDYLMKTKHISPKNLHDQIAQLGTFDNIFTQPTDNFVPPLVMAKSKLSNDMTVITLEEKYAQREAEHKKEIASMKKQHAAKSQEIKYAKPDVVAITLKAGTYNETRTNETINEDTKNLTTENTYDIPKENNTKKLKLAPSSLSIKPNITILKNKDIVKATNIKKKYNSEKQTLRKKLQEKQMAKPNNKTKGVIAITESQRPEYTTVEMTSKSMLSTETIPVTISTNDYESTTDTVKIEDIVTSTDSVVLNVTSGSSTTNGVNEHNESITAENILSTTMNSLEVTVKLKTNVKFDGDDKSPIIEIDMNDAENRHSSSQMTTTDKSNLYSGNLDSQDLPRPNRSRKLSTPQRSKFYPYLRILG